jgi:hypothetical protein
MKGGKKIEWKLKKERKGTQQNKTEEDKGEKEKGGSKAKKTEDRR